MKALEDHLSRYATYHRDARNIASHFVGIPMIVAAVTVLLSRPSFEIGGGVVLSAAVVAAVVTGLYYLLLDRPLALLMCVLLALAVWFGAWTATLATATWLGIGIGLFVVGWALQMIGHAWEGRKPAFLDDVTSLLIGPLFVVSEALFLLGLRAELRTVIESRAGRIRTGRGAVRA